jgi:outer membrane protein assembly factor BamD
MHVTASIALENSRRQYALKDRAALMFLHKPDVVMAARDGEPPMTDATPTLAPHITTQIVKDFKDALNPDEGKPATVAAQPAAATDTPAASAAAAAADQPAAAPAAAAPLQFQEVPNADAGGGSGAAAVDTSVPNSATTPAPAGNSMGVEILTPGAAAKPADDNGGLKAVGPPDATPLPAIEKAGGAPDAVNDITPGTQAPAQAPRADGKKPKPEFDKGSESSSKHKKKKGLNKINPF